MNWSSQSRASSLELIVAFCVSSVFVLCSGIRADPLVVEESKRNIRILVNKVGLKAVVELLSSSPIPIVIVAWLCFSTWWNEAGRHHDSRLLANGQ